MPDEKIPKAPVGWKKETGRFDEEAEKGKKPGGDKERKTIPLKKEMQEKGVRLKAKDIYDILRKGFGKGVTFTDKIEFRLYWIFLRTWVYREFHKREKPWKRDRFEFIEDLMREFAGSEDGKSFKELIERILKRFSDDLEDTYDELKELRGPGKRFRRLRLRGDITYLKGVIKELKRICEELEKAK